MNVNQTFVKDADISAATLNSGIHIKDYMPPDGASVLGVYVTEATADSGARVRITEGGRAATTAVGGTLKQGYYEFYRGIRDLKLINETSDGCSVYLVFARK